MRHKNKQYQTQEKSQQPEAKPPQEKYGCFNWVGENARTAVGLALAILAMSPFVSYFKANKARGLERQLIIPEVTDVAENINANSNMHINPGSNFIEPNNIKPKPNFVESDPAYAIDANNFYITTHGQSLWKISKITGVSINNLKKYNNIKDINKIYPWKVLSLKPNVSLKNPNEVIALTQKVYAEAANQPSRARKLIPRVALNRVGRKGYPKTLLSVLGQRAAGKNKYAFSCANDGGNHPWKQIMGKIKMNSNDRKIVQDCFKDVISVLNGEETCICRENDIEAYHDTSTTYEYLTSEARGKKDRAYWQSLEEVDRAGAFIAYAKRN